FFMTSGNEVPLRVAETWSQVRLQTDHRLVKCVTEAVADNRIDVAILDPLVTLHGVPENNSGQMDQVIRIFTRIADTRNCAIDLSHHTRKLAPGSADDYGIDDMRGAGAVKDAMRPSGCSTSWARRTPRRLEWMSWSAPTSSASTAPR